MKNVQLYSVKPYVIGQAEPMPHVRGDEPLLPLR